MKRTWSTKNIKDRNISYYKRNICQKSLILFNTLMLYTYKALQIYSLWWRRNNVKMWNKQKIEEDFSWKEKCNIQSKFGKCEGATIAQWIRLHLRSWGARFESHAHHLRFYSKFCTISDIVERKDKYKQKEAGFGHCLNEGIK